MNIYSEIDKQNALAQRKKILSFFYIVTGIYVFILIVNIVLYVRLPYKDPMQNLYSMIIYVVTAIYIIFAYLYLGIKFKRCNDYCKYMKSIDEDLKSTWQGEFCGFYEGSRKNNIDVDICVIRNWIEKKQVYDEHHFHIDREKDIPPFDFGDIVKITTVGSIIIAYEIIQKGETL